MAFSKVSYTQSVPGNQNFTVSFPYLEQSHISVEVEGSPVTFTWLDATTVVLDVAPAVSEVVQIIRTTSRTARLVDFVDGTVINEKQLDRNALQVFYLVQEAIDEIDGVVAENALGQLDAVSRQIINVLDPTEDQHAATKAYVDAIVLTVAADAAAAAASAAAAAVSETNADASAVAAAASEAVVVAAATDITNATPNPTADTLIKRDANARAQVAAPSAGSDIVNKTYADGLVPKLVYSAAISAGATIDLPSVLESGSYDYYRVALINPEVASGSADLLCRITDDDGTTYENTNYSWAITTMNPGATSLAYAEGASANALTLYQGLSNDFGWSGFFVDFYGPNRSGGKPLVHWRGGENWAGSTFKVDGVGNTGNTGSNTITGLQFLLSASTFVAVGEVRVYGSNTPFV